MWCPKCKSEYVQGIVVCPECGIALVDKLPEEELSEKKIGSIQYEVLLVTYNASDIPIIKSILDSAGITYYFHGENFILVRPLVEPARLMVKKDEIEQAKELLKDLNIQFWGISLRDEQKDK